MTADPPAECCHGSEPKPGAGQTKQASHGSYSVATAASLRPGKLQNKGFFFSNALARPRARCQPSEHLGKAFLLFSNCREG